MSKFTLDQKDLATDQFVNQIGHMATDVETRTDNVSSIYKINDVQLVHRFDEHKLGTPLNSLGLKIKADLIGYKQGEDTRQLVDMDLTHHNPDEKRPRDNGVELLYELNTPETVKMFNGGLNDFPAEYMHKMQNQLNGQTFSRDDNVQITKLTFEKPVDSIGTLDVDGFTARENYTIYAATPNTKEHHFDSLAKNNSFTYTLSKTLDDAVEDYQHPETRKKFADEQARQFSIDDVDNYDEAVDESRAVKEQDADLGDLNEISFDDIADDIKPDSQPEPTAEEDAPVIGSGDELNFGEDSRPKKPAKKSHDDELEL